MNLTGTRSRVRTACPCTRAGRNIDCPTAFSAGSSNAAFALGVFVYVGDADLLFRSGDAIDQSDGISDGEFCLKKNKCAA